MNRMPMIDIEAATRSVMAMTRCCSAFIVGAMTARLVWSRFDTVGDAVLSEATG